LDLQNRAIFGTEKRSMKKLFLSLVVLACAGAAHAAAPADLIARIHFSGAEKISADADSAAFTNFFCCAEARVLESQTLDKLSRAPAMWFKDKLPAGAGDGAAQLRPLLDDLLKSEWVFEMRDTSTGSPEYALAVRLNSERAQAWQGNLQGLLESWTKIAAQKVPGGWELQKHQPPNLFRFQRSGDWVVIDCGENELLLDGAILGPFLKTRIAAPETNWLTADLDWPRLARWFPVLARFDFAKIQMQVIGRGGDLHLSGKIISPQPFGLTLDKWRLPTNTIHQPFVSFTAVRGIAPWLQRQGWAQQFEISPVPNQVYFWALPQVAFQTFAAVPVPDANAALDQLYGRIAASHEDPQGQFFMPLHASMANHEISWTGVPFAAPFVRALREPAGDFLFAGLFPNLPRSKQLPPELFTALAPANLVYYNWEITAERLKLLLQPVQLAFVLSRHRQFDEQLAAAKWLNHVGPMLGNTITEVTQTAPDELTFTRNAPGGLTAVELFALAYWLESANFPGLDPRLPPRIRLHAHPVKILSAPSTPAPK
jgi:hypothetical protein